MKVFVPDNSIILDIVDSNIPNIINDYTLSQYPEWSSQVNYGIAPGTIVSYQGKWYQSISPLNTSNTGKIPDQFPTYWKLLGISGFDHEISVSSPYDVGEVIEYNNRLYKSLISQTLNIADLQNSTKWEFLGYSNFFRQFDSQSSTSFSFANEYTWKASVPLNEKDTIPALAMTDLQNVVSAELEITADPTAIDYKRNLVPIVPYLDIESFTTPNYYGSGEELWNAFSGDINRGWRGTKLNDSTEVTIKLYRPIAIQGLEITTGDNINYDPVQLLIFGSNTGANNSWTAVYETTNLQLTDSRLTKSDLYEFILDDNAYLYYKLLFIGTKLSNNSQIDVNEIKLYYDSVDAYRNLRNFWTYFDPFKPASDIQYLPNQTYVQIPYGDISNVTTNSPTTPYSDEGATKAFDNDLASKWWDAMPPEGPNYMWAQIQLFTRRCVQKIQFVTGNDEPGRDPTVYVLYGSDNGQEWTLIDHRGINLPDTRLQSTEIYDLNNIYSYYYYRVIFYKAKDPRNYYGNLSFQIQEIKLLYSQEDPYGEQVRGNNYPVNNDFNLIAQNPNTGTTIIATPVSYNLNSIPSPTLNPPLVYYNRNNTLSITEWKPSIIPNIPFLAYSAKYLKNMFVICGPNNFQGQGVTVSGKILYSLDDGISFQAANLPSGINGIYCVEYCSGNINKFVAIDYTGKILTSIDGITYTWENSRTLPSTTNPYYATQLSWGEGVLSTGVLVCVGQGGESGPTMIWTDDLDTWWITIVANLTENNALYDVKFNNSTKNPQWLVSGINGLYRIFPGASDLYIENISSTLFNTQYNGLDSGYPLGITYDSFLNNWLICGFGYRSGSFTSTPFIYRLESIYSTYATVEVLDNKFAGADAYFKDIIVDINHKVIAPIRNILVIKNPIYYKKVSLNIEDSNKLSSSLAYLTDIPTGYTKYSKLIYHIRLIGKDIVKIPNTFFGYPEASIGDVQKGVNLSIVDYSVKTIDEFGNISIVTRPYTDKVTLQLLVPITEVNRVKTILNSLRAKPAIWQGSDESKYQNLTIYGFYKTYSISIDNPAFATVSIELESLL
jgi:hypothetical protein